MSFAYECTEALNVRQFVSPKLRFLELTSLPKINILLCSI